MTLKEIIDELERRNGGCISRVAAKYGIPYQTLNNWRRNANKTKQLIDFYNKALKDLKK